MRLMSTLDGIYVVYNLKLYSNLSESSLL